MPEYKRVDRDILISICEQVLIKSKCSKIRAAIVADVCVEADLRGVFSHGVARLERYIKHIEDGIIDPLAEPEIMYKTPMTAVYDGNNGIGQYVSKIACEKAVHMAARCGIGIVTVKNSNHYGIAGYWAEQIMKNGMIGISSTNSAPLVVPTFGRKAMLGTNPIAISFPSNNEAPFMIDMATSVVPRGKVEVYSRNDLEIPVGWAVDEKGYNTNNPTTVLKNAKEKSYGGLLPLGGEAEDYGGHKGYGLALLVELLTAGLSNGEASFDTYGKSGGICHFFMGIRLDLFGNSEKLIQHITNILQQVKNSEKAFGKKEIFLHNEKEYLSRVDSLKNGIRVDGSTFDKLLEICKKYSINIDLNNIN
ncbi:MAG: Ldh family oxidoreductase [Caldisericia bacterium]|nr:Ldh family oxidoreductase [Caldisericia bacterium]